MPSRFKRRQLHPFASIFVFKSFEWSRKKIKSRKLKMNSELSTEGGIQILLLFEKFESFNEVRDQWNNHFSSQEPDTRTISNTGCYLFFTEL